MMNTDFRQRKTTKNLEITQKSTTILVVDDNAQNLSVVFDSLAGFGFIVLVAQTAESAFRLVKEEIPDLILLDVKLPDIDGYEVCRQLKSSSDVEDVPIIFMTILSDPLDKIKGFEAGGMDYITKPFQPEELLARVKAHLTIRQLQLRLQKQIQLLEHEVEERKQMEVQLQEAKKKAESANEAKSIFFANMSHELRTPLNGILGYTQLLKRDASLTEKQQQEIEVIHYSGEHLLLMIDDVLDLSKIEARKMELERKDFHLLQFLHTLVDIVRIHAQQKGLSFTSHFAHDLPTGVHGDEKRLRQILLNILNNAIKFTEKGCVTFRVIQRSPSSPQSSIRLRFEVEDDGIGIDQDKLEEIFLPFHQVSDKQFQKKGTGLGLSISRQLVHMMGGELSVLSSKGEGSTFRCDIDFPEVLDIPEPDTRKRYRKIIGFEGDTRKVLIVDDDESNRGVLKDICLPLGFTVFEAASGLDALSTVVECAPDIIFVDLLMPLMDGFETIQRIRQSPALVSITIIAVSAGVREKNREQILAAGCDAYISKPFSIEEILEALRTHLNLTWLYDETTEPQVILKIEPEQTEIIPPPQEELHELLNLAMMGDVVGLQEQINILEKHDAKFARFAYTIHQLTHEFLIEEIQTFLQQYTEEQ